MMDAARQKMCSGKIAKATVEVEFKTNEDSEMTNLSIVEALGQIAREKNVDREMVVQTLKDALVSAAKSDMEIRRITWPR